MAKVSEKDILKKLNKMKKNAKSSGLFRVEAKIDMRIKNIYKKKKQKSLFEF